MNAREGGSIRLQGEVGDTFVDELGTVSVGDVAVVREIWRTAAGSSSRSMLRSLLFDGFGECVLCAGV